MEASPITPYLCTAGAYRSPDTPKGTAGVKVYQVSDMHLRCKGMGCNPNGVAWHGEDDCQYTKGVKKLAVGAKSGGQFSDATPPVREAATTPSLFTPLVYWQFCITKKKIGVAPKRCGGVKHNLGNEPMCIADITPCLFLIRAPLHRRGPQVHCARSD